MAWSWLYNTTQGYNRDLRNKLENKSAEWLAEAIADARWGMGMSERKNGPDVHDTYPEISEDERDDLEKQLLEDHNIEELANKAFDVAADVDLCDNGAWAVWIDPEGYHKISMTDDGEQK